MDTLKKVVRLWEPFCILVMASKDNQVSLLC